MLYLVIFALVISIIFVCTHMILWPDCSLREHKVPEKVQDKQERRMIDPIILNGTFVNTYSAFEKDITSDEGWPVPDRLHHNGWRYTNTVLCKNLVTNAFNKINWYFFINNTMDAKYNYSKFKTFYVRIRLDSASTFLPFVSIFTAKQNDGHDAGSFYRSRKNYTETGVLDKGKEIIIWIGKNPNRSITNYEFTSDPSVFNFYVGPTGQTDIDPSENISLIALQTSSIDTVGQVDFTLLEVGYRFSSGSKLYKTLFPAI